MNINFQCKNLYFGEYKNTKYSKEVKPRNSNVSDNESVIYNYSKNKIKNLYYFGVCNGSYQIPPDSNYDKSLVENRGTEVIYSKLSAPGRDSSNMEMILDLVQNGKLSNEVLYYFDENSKISSDVNSDLDKLFNAYAQGVNEEDVFVPEFSNSKEAQGIKTGEICHIKGDKNISIKTPDGKIQELFITKETYMELFPPVERFIIRQANVGDCYILSAIEAVYQNPNTRFKILEMFKENPNGTIDITFGGFKKDEDNKIIPKKNGFILKDINKHIENFKGKKLSHTAKWAAAIELLNGAERNMAFDEKGIDIEKVDLNKNSDGNPCEILKKIGFKKPLSDSPYSDKMEDILFSQHAANNVFIGSTFSILDKNRDNFEERHCYSIMPIDNEGCGKFAIKNPYNTAFEIILTYPELIKYFERITVGSKI